MHHFSDMAAIILCHPDPKADLQRIDARLNVQNIQDRLGFVSLWRFVVNLSDDSCKDFLFAELDDYPRTQIDLRLKVFRNSICKHPRDRHGQNDICEVISAFLSKKILISKQAFHQIRLNKGVVRQLLSSCLPAFGRHDRSRHKLRHFPPNPEFCPEESGHFLSENQKKPKSN